MSAKNKIDCLISEKWFYRGGETGNAFACTFDARFFNSRSIRKYKVYR